MFALPSLAGIPATIQPVGGDVVAAGMAIELLPRRAPFRVKAGTERYEVRALQSLITDRLGAKLEALRVFDLAIWLRTDMDLGTSDVMDAPENAQGLVFIGNRTSEYIDGAWTLERRWKALEARAPGLAEAALRTLCLASRSGLQLYTPDVAVYYCSHIHWHGESDEGSALWDAVDPEDLDGREIEDLTKAELEELADKIGMWTRTKLDAAIPNAVQWPKERKVPLARLARGRGEAAEVARTVLAVRAALAADRGRKGDPYMHSGYQDELVAFGYGAAVRWNNHDPMMQFFDDYGQQYGQDSAVEPIHGWYVYEPGNLDRIITLIEKRLDVAALTEELLGMIATRGRS